MVSDANEKSASAAPRSDAHVSAHFVTFFSPGTFMAETTTKPIADWRPAIAARMAREITERHGAKPYAFQFITRERGENDLDSKEVNRSGKFYLGGKVMTLEEIE